MDKSNDLLRGPEDAGMGVWIEEDVEVDDELRRKRRRKQAKTEGVRAGRIERMREREEKTTNLRTLKKNA